MNDKIDLFESLVRYFAVKPLKVDNLDFEEAQNVIKKDKAAAVNFVGEHGYFEQSLEAMLNQAANLGLKTGTIYINVKGQGCTERVKRKLMELAMSVGQVIIFGVRENWPIIGENIKFTSNDDIFVDNHQRFFICQTPSFNIALVSRHEMHEGVEKTEAIITNDADAISLLGITIGTKIYPLV
jgi:hypothetical protein